MAGRGSSHRWRRSLFDRLVDYVLFGKGTKAPVKQRAMLSQDEITRRLRVWRESAEGQELEDMLIAAALEELPHVEDVVIVVDDLPAMPVVDKRSSYMVADVEFDEERIVVSFAMPLNVAQELLGHVNSATEYEEAAEACYEFLGALCDVMAKAMFGK